jgi:receptor protein-tyrosine kinase
VKINDYYDAFLRGWWILAATLCIGIGAALLYSYSQPDKYVATATYFATSRLRTNDPGDVVDSMDTLASRAGVVNTYCHILESRTLLEEAAQSLDVSPAAISDYQSNCSVSPESSILEVEVNGTSPALVTDLANAIGTVGIAYIEHLQEVYELRKLDEASIPDSPSSPNHFMDLAMGAFISFVGGALLVLLRAGLTGFIKLDTNTESPNNSSEF